MIDAATAELMIHIRSTHPPAVASVKKINLKTGVPLKNEERLLSMKRMRLSLNKLINGRAVLRVRRLIKSAKRLVVLAALHLFYCWPLLTLSSAVLRRLNLQRCRFAVLPRSSWFVGPLLACVALVLQSGSICGLPKPCNQIPQCILS